jgi:hypothetical protein
MSPTDFVVIGLIFGEFFLFLAIANYFEKRGEKHKKQKQKISPSMRESGPKASWFTPSILTIWKYLPLPLGLKSEKSKDQNEKAKIP